MAAMNCDQIKKLIKEHKKNKPDDNNSNYLRNLLFQESRLCLNGFQLGVQRQQRRPPPLFLPLGFRKSATKKVGTKDEVWNGLCKKTSGGLTKKDLKLNKSGKVVSKLKSALAIKNNYLNL